MLFIRNDNFKIFDSHRMLEPGTYFPVLDSMAPAIRELNIKGYRTLRSSIHPVFGPCISFEDGTDLPRLPSSVWVYQDNILHVNPLAEECSTNSKDSIFCTFELYRWACNLPYRKRLPAEEESDFSCFIPPVFLPQYNAS